MRRLHPDHKKFHDVVFGKRENVLSLRSRVVHVEFSVAAAHRAYQKHRLVLIGCGVFLILGIAFGVFRSVTWADSAVLYPSTCLGGWNNPQHAEGELDVASLGDPSAFTESNSAVLPANASSEIFCGGFTGAMSLEAQPTKITLTFSWTTKNEAAPIIITDSTPDTSATSSIDITAPATSTSTPDVAAPPVDLTTPDPATPTFDASSTPDMSTSAPTPPTADPSSDAPISLLYFLTPTAHAQEAATTTVDLAASSTLDASTTPDSTTTSIEQNPSGGGFLDVSYTLDGNTWHDLGTVNTAQLASASFAIPIAPGASWKDMSNLQISIRSIPSLDPTPTVYLDGMSLHTDYAEGKLQSAITSDKTSYASTDSIVLTSIPVGSYVEIYWLDDPDTAPEASNVFAVQAGDHDSTQVEAATLHPGKFALVNTLDPDHCGGLSLEQCRQASTFLSEVAISIAP